MASCEEKSRIQQIDYVLRSLIHKNFSIVLSSDVLGTAPITASFFSPLLKIKIVGMLRTPYWLAIEGLSSVFSLKQLSLPVYCFASSPITGWSIRQGPHHGAQNSTSTGPSVSRTSDCHVASVTLGTAAWQKNEKHMNITFKLLDTNKSLDTGDRRYRI